MLLLILQQLYYTQVMTETSPIILADYQAVKKAVEHYRTQGKTICLTQGSFDMLHIGHGRYLAKAKSQADILIVGADSDEKIRARKGKDRPVVPQEERLEMLSQLKSVDHAVLKELSEPKWHLIKMISPDVLVATTSTYSPAELEELHQWCGKIVVLEPQATTSTSAKLRRLQIGFAHNFSTTLTERIHAAIDQTLAEMKE